MKTSLPYKKIIVEVVCCLYILLFVYAAISKLLDFENFRIQLAQSPLLSAYAGIVAPGIIGLELLLAGLLVIRSGRLVSLLACYFLMVSFTVYIYIILNYSEFVPCSCGGILEKLGWYEHMIFNIAFAVLGILALLLSVADKVKIKRATLYVVFTTLLAIGTMIVLYLSSEYIIKKENNFTRRYLQHPVQEEEVYDLKFNSYYFSGYADGKIYLGNYTAPLVLTSIDTTLVHTQARKIVLDNPHRNLSNQLKQQAEQLGVLNNATPVDTDKVAMPIFNSPFPFSKRMYNMLNFLEVGTIGELAAIPLKNLHNIKGFKAQCRKELIAFIEFESIQDLFEGYWKWKKL